MGKEDKRGILKGYYGLINPRKAVYKNYSFYKE
jgi:hypothetical protein